MIKKTIVIAGQQGERGDKAEEYSVPIDGVLGYTETGTPDGYVEAGYFKVTGLDEVDSRIDVIESLPEGSTSGDAEVADIRVGVDGEIYDSAGIAVRDQITELHDYAESIDDVQDAQIETLKVTKAVEGEYITINDAAALPANEYSLTLSPVQNLNGYDSPWVGGGGKNKFEPKGYDGLGYNVSAGTAVTFSDSAIYVTVNNNVMSYAVSSWQGVGFKTPTLAAGSYHINLELQGNNRCSLYVIGTDGKVKSVANYSDANANIIADRTVESGEVIAVWIGNNGASSITVTNYQIESGQSFTSWTPYSNICPIHGADEVGVRVCGVNIWDEDWELGMYDSNKPTVIPVVDSTHIRSKNPIPVVANTTYFMLSAGANTHIIVADDEGNVLFESTTLNNGTFTTPANAKYVYFNMALAYGTTYNHDISINYPSTDHDYHTYTLHSTTITLPSTVYGGSVEQGGSGQVTLGLIDLSTLSSWGSDSPNANGFIRYVSPISGKKSGYNMYCSSFKVSDTLIPGNTTEEGISGYSANSNIYLAIDSNRLTGDLTTADGRKAALLAWLQSNTVTVAYELATPTDISLTPFPQTLLEGINNVWAECSEDGSFIGDAEQDLTYQRDTTLVIQNLINRIVELERRN